VGAHAPDVTFDELLRLATAEEPHALTALHRMARALGEGLADLASGLAPDVIVIVGELTALWNRVGPIVQEAIADRAVPNATRILPTDPAARPRLRGAIALVVQQHFGAPAVA
jgi:predicted NBD/HSP70 family sugar kinase